MKALAGCRVSAQSPHHDGDPTVHLIHGTHFAGGPAAIMRMWYHVLYLWALVCAFYDFIHIRMKFPSC